MAVFLLLLLPLILLEGQGTSAQNLEKSRSVWVEQGLVRGKIYKFDDNHIQIFRGIPYAEPPLGSLRFRKPVKKTRWHEELLAIEFGPACIQWMDFHTTDKYSADNMQRQSEDCLHLSVFSPFDAEDEGQLYPIVVWIHGGSFLAGSGDTGIDLEVVAKNLVFKGVTLVTVNYRLGPLGFMSIQHGDGKIEANFGMWDLVMALQWIQANIKQFNGDPRRVTVMGESAGATAASILAASPRTEGLVHGAIVMSGSAFAGWGIHRHGEPSWSIHNLASYLRCDKLFNEDDMQELAKHKELADLIKDKACNLQDKVPQCLQDEPDMDSRQLLECFQKEVNFSSALFRRSLAIELAVSKVVVDDDLVPRGGPSALLERSARLPLLIGVAQHEWSHKKPQFYNIHGERSFRRPEAETLLRRVIDHSFLSSAPDRLSNATLALVSSAAFGRYVQRIDDVYPMADLVTALQDMEADIEFVAPAQREIDAYVAKNLSVFVYSFDYMPKSTIVEREKKTTPLTGPKAVTLVRSEKIAEKPLQPFHGLDHAFIFTQGYSSNFAFSPFTKQDAVMSALLTDMWTSFIRSGDPSTDKFVWPAYSDDDRRWVSLNLPLRVRDGTLHHPAPTFWNEQASMMARYVAKGSADSALDPDAELSNGERVQLLAHGRAWLALWLIVGLIAVFVWLVVLYVVLRRGSATPRAKPYHNIVLSN